jgi:spore germination cell wall hydrolase CwlJ-like protein
MKKIIPNILVCILIVYGIIQITKLQYSHSIYNRHYANLTVQEQYDELDCLTENIYYEATNEPIAGMIGVAQVTINRTESPKFPKSICLVVHQDSQFSWVKSKPKSLVNINKRAWDDAREIAKRVLLEGERLDSVKESLYYHTADISTVWDKDMKLLTKLGHHNFYKEG